MRRKKNKKIFAYLDKKEKVGRIRRRGGGKTKTNGESRWWRQQKSEEEERKRGSMRGCREGTKKRGYRRQRKIENLG